MSRPCISREDLSTTLHLSDRHATGEHPRGYWLYDDTRGMNLAMGALTKESALVEALMYYQKRLKEVEQEHKALTEKVSSFVSQFRDDE